MAIINLSDIAAGRRAGLRIEGQDTGGATGTDVGVIGDLDGDGRDEVVVGDPLNAAAGVRNSGAAYVVFSNNRTEQARAGGGQLLDLDDISSAAVPGFKIRGEAAGNFAGQSVSSVRDVSGDGKPEILVGAPGVLNPSPLAAPLFPPTGPGAAYVVFGKSNMDAVNLSTLANPNTPAELRGGYVIRGERLGDAAGWSIAPINDQNGPDQGGVRRDEVLVGAPGHDAGGLEDAGAVYVVFGKMDTGAVNLSRITDPNTPPGQRGGYVIRGEKAGDMAGWSVAQSFDLNGDGRDEVLVGAPLGGPESNGVVYVVFSKDPPNDDPVNLADVAAGRGGFAIYGERLGDMAGWSVAPIDDLNRDGIPEILVGAPFNDRFTDTNELLVNAGAAYVVFGKAGGERMDGTSAPVNLSAVAGGGSGGYVIRGENSNDRAGWSVGLSFDLSGDGRDEVLVGAPLNDADLQAGQNEGAVYVVFGKAGGELPGDRSSPVSLSGIAGGDGYKIVGTERGGEAGRSVSVVGDLGGDGQNEVLVGAPFADPSGVAYEVFF